MVRKEEFYYDSRDDISKIHAVKWIPQAEVGCILQIAHGMAEYILRYDGFATWLAERGILVVGNDHLGHGQSGDQESGSSIKGYFCRRDAATVLVRDVHRLKKMVQADYPGVPYIIMGHSMGSFVVRNYLCNYGRGVSGAIIMGTGMPPKGLIFVSKAAAAIQDLVMGEDHVSKFLDKLAFGVYNKRISNPTTRFDWLSSDPETVRAYLEDPLCGFVFTVNGFQTLFELISRVYDKEKLRKIPGDLPVLVISGEQDPVGDYGAGIKRAAASLQEAGLRNVTVSLYRQERHELVMEQDRQKVYEEIYLWLMNRTGESGSK